MNKFSRPALNATMCFAAGLVGHVLLANTDGDTTARFMHSARIQILAYGAGLMILTIWWFRSTDFGPRAPFGCLGLIALAIFSGIMILFSGYQ